VALNVGPEPAAVPGLAGGVALSTGPGREGATTGIELRPAPAHVRYSGGCTENGASKSL
jgi:hypothetical protein